MKKLESLGNASCFYGHKPHFDILIDGWAAECCCQGASTFGAIGDRLLLKNSKTRVIFGSSSLDPKIISCHRVRLWNDLKLGMIK